MVNFAAHMIRSPKPTWPSLFLIVSLVLYGLLISPALRWLIEQSGFEPMMPSLFVLTIAVWCRRALFKKPLSGLQTDHLVVIAFGAIGSVLTFPILKQLSAGFAIFGLYGFLGTLPSLRLYWRQGLIIAALTALALPFALVRGTGLGFYLRLMTADVASHILALLGYASMGAHDVLIFDNGIAQVDAPCSGLKSLFTGTFFFLVLSLVLRRQVSAKWVLIYACFIVLLLCANTVRVIILIFLADISDNRSLADAIHVPLGLALFAAACLFPLWAFRLLPKFQPEALAPKSGDDNITGSLLLLALLIICFFLPSQTPTHKTKIVTPQIEWLEPLRLSATETRFFGSKDNTHAAKWRFKEQGLSGSILVVRSGALNGLHAPELCFLGNGLIIDTMKTQSVSEGQVRQLSLNEGAHSALYWMQSGPVITDNFGQRLKRFLSNGQRDWTLITILFDHGHATDTIESEILRQRLMTQYSLDQG